MPTYISMLNWSGEPQPQIEEVRSAIALHSPALKRRGLHSVAFLPDEGACCAVMVATVDNPAAITSIATSILPKAIVRIESMRFDDDSGTREPARRALPPPPRNFHRALLEAIEAA